MRRIGLAVALTLSLCLAPLGEAQQTGKVYRVGELLTQYNPTDTFRQSLRGLGYEEGRNLVIEYRWHEGKFDRLPALVAELVSLKPDVIFVTGNEPTAAVKAATTTIPIVFASVGDPVGLGLVSSLARPGGNVTGFSAVVPEGFAAKQFELLHEAVPGAARIAVLINPANAGHRGGLSQTVAAAEQLKVKLQILEARTLGELQSAFEAATRARAGAVHVYGDPLTWFHRARIAQLAAMARLPAIYQFRDNVAAGGLMSYGASNADLLRRSAGYVDKILKGAKPADLPVEQPTKFELVINMKTAKALGLTIPQSLLVRADEIIQ
jgi:putative tryptophan/tyrosine transport system substrate-binding protein